MYLTAHFFPSGTRGKIKQKRRHKCGCISRQVLLDTERRKDRVENPNTLSPWHPSSVHLACIMLKDFPFSIFLVWFWGLGGVCVGGVQGAQSAWVFTAPHSRGRISIEDQVSPSRSAASERLSCVAAQWSASPTVAAALSTANLAATR